jgi:hypothetical protein
MQTEIAKKISQAVQTELQWKPEEIDIDEVESLKRAPCTFYTASQKVRPVATMPNFAVLPDDIVISPGEQSVGTIIKTCGTGASAQWLAQVIVRFYPALAGALVVEREGGFHGAVETIRKSNRVFAPPTLAHNRLTFFAVMIETNQASLVIATFAKDGTVKVEVAGV